MVFSSPLSQGDDTNIQAKRSGAAGRSNAHNALGSTRPRILLASASGADSPDARGAEPATARVKLARSAASASPSSRRARPPTGGLYAGNASRGRPPLSGVRHFSANECRKRGSRTPEQQQAAAANTILNVSRARTTSSAVGAPCLHYLFYPTFCCGGGVLRGFGGARKG